MNEKTQLIVVLTLVNKPCKLIEALFGWFKVLEYIYEVQVNL